jgi:hypothetical protein
VPINHSISSVPRVDISTLTPEAFSQHYQQTGTPVVITGLLEDEPDWTLDYLCAKIGDREFMVRNYQQANSNSEPSQPSRVGSGVALETMRFSDYAELLRHDKVQENDLYLAKAPLQTTPLTQTSTWKTLGDKLGLTQPVTDFKMYIGSGIHRSGLHYDIMDNTLIQLHGIKKIVLFPPFQIYNLYPFPILGHLRHGMKLRCCFSRVSLDHPDFDAFPKFNQALEHKQEVILERGETLYLPAGWWHDISGIDNAMMCSVNRFWHIYPPRRAWLNWQRWRAILGVFCAIPYIGVNLITALFQPHPQLTIRQILYRI